MPLPIFLHLSVIISRLKFYILAKNKLPIILNLHITLFFVSELLLILSLLPEMNAFLSLPLETPTNH